MRSETNCPGRSVPPVGNSARTSTVSLFLSTFGLTNESAVVTGGSVSTCTSSSAFKPPASAAGISALTARRFKSITSATTVLTSTAVPGLTLTRVTVPDNGAVMRNKASCTSASCKFFNEVFCCANNFFCRSTCCAAFSAVVAPGESVVTDESGKSVIALVKGDEATQKPVQTGLRENGWIEIAAPELKAGDVVVTVG